MGNGSQSGDDIAMIRSRLVRAALLLLLLGVPGGCRTNQGPRPIEAVTFRERALTQESHGVRVTAAVPSADETRELFDADFYDKGVQPVWLEVENGLEDEVAFLPVGLDPRYYTPIEAALLSEAASDDTSGRDVARNLLEHSMSLIVGPGETRSGFVFTPLDEGTKSFNVDIMGSEAGLQFSFFISVPGLQIDHDAIDWDARETNADAVALGEIGDIVAALEALPCCTTDKADQDLGDPLNLVVIGSPADVYYAFIRAGWDETETIHGSSLWKTAVSFLTGSEYRYSPVSALYVFGRPQDVAFQKARDNIHERNHLRLWMSDLRWEGFPVWIGQISRDIGVRFTRRTITTHKIDPDVDETREFLHEDLAYSQALARVGYVGGVGAAAIDEPRGNLTGDPYFTDGHRVVLWVSSRPVALDGIETLDWRPVPYD